MKRPIILAMILMFASSSLCLARVVKQYFPDGKIYSVQNYDDQNNIIGPFKIYWQNGRLREKIIYKNGQPYIIKRWTINGVRIQ